MGICGIAGGFSGDGEAAMRALAHRGPDAQALSPGGAWLAHTRLAIQDLDSRSNQPFVYGGTTIVYNGEMWNRDAVRAWLIKRGDVLTTSGDTEVMAALLNREGFRGLQHVQGMFAVAWRQAGDNGVWIARDRFGEVPLHMTDPSSMDGGFFASELKGIRAAGGFGPVENLKPGTAAYLRQAELPDVYTYYEVPVRPVSDDLEYASARVRELVIAGSVERTIADVPVCVLLSGGVDSSAIAYAVSRTIPNLVAYTAVLDPKSRDLRCAREVAERLGIELVEVAVPVPTTEDLARVVGVIEMPYKAQVEIGWACLVLAQRMHEDGFKVTFSGEGSDELWASYGFAYHALKTQDWHTYRRDLFVTQERKNFMRANKAFMAYGVECRLPFLHTALVEYALSLKRDAVKDGSNDKAVMTRAFADVLPESVISRPKVAFQDGMGLKRAIAETVLDDPKSFYMTEYRRRFL